MRSNWPFEPAERRVLGDLPRHLGVAQAEPQLAGALVDHGVGDHLVEQLPVEAERARLVGQDRPAELAAELLQPVLIELAELSRSGFRSPPTLASVDWPKPRKMSPMPQIAKLMAIRPRTTPMTARPIQLEEALVNTSEHETVRFVWMSGQIPGRLRRGI